MNTSVYTTKEIADKVRPIAEKYGADKVYLFGSYARNEATEESDIDFYVEFSKPIGLKYCSFFSDIEDSVDKKIDIVTKDALYNPVTITINEDFINRVLKERKCIYEQQGYRG